MWSTVLVVKMNKTQRGFKVEEIEQLVKLINEHTKSTYHMEYSDDNLLCRMLYDIDDKKDGIASVVITTKAMSEGLHIALGILRREGFSKPK